MSVDPAALPRLFHGGRPGLKPGALVVPGPPHVVDGCKICEARAAGEHYMVPGLGSVDPPTGRPDRVYFTSDRPYGFYYASRYWRGDLYVVEPVGTVEESTEDPFPTWCAPYAVVRSVYSRCVQLTMSERRRLYRRWTIADALAAQRTRDEKAARLRDGLE